MFSALDRGLVDMSNLKSDEIDRIVKRLATISSSFWLASVTFSRTIVGFSITSASSRPSASAIHQSHRPTGNIYLPDELDFLAIRILLLTSCSKKKKKKKGASQYSGWTGTLIKMNGIYTYTPLFRFIPKTRKTIRSP